MSNSNESNVNNNAEDIAELFLGYFYINHKDFSHSAHIKDALKQYGPNFILDDISIFAEFIEFLIQYIDEQKEKKIKLAVKGVEAFLNHPDFDSSLLHSHTTYNTDLVIYELVKACVNKYVKELKRNIPKYLIDLILLLVEKGADPFKKYESEGESAEILVKGLLNMRDELGIPTESLETLDRAFKRYYNSEYGTPGVVNRRNNTRKNKNSNDPKNVNYKKPNNKNSNNNSNKALSENLKENTNRNSTSKNKK